MPAVSIRTVHCENALRRFYGALGFVALDDPVPIRTDPDRLAAWMARPV